MCCDAYRSKNDRRYVVGRTGECDVCGEVKPLKHGARGRKTTCADCHAMRVDRESREREERKAVERLAAIARFAASREEKEARIREEREEKMRLMELSRQEELLARRCRSCGDLLLPFIKPGEYSAIKVCPDCAKAAIRRSKAISRAARKAKQRSVSVELINPIHVLDRDGWVCHICGRKTPKEKRGSYDDDAPEVDHIITLSEGGEHSYRNTACACRSCNLKKGGKSFGQLHLGLI